MTNEEKKFKIQKIEKYNDELSKAKKETSENAFWLGLLAIAVAVQFSCAITLDDEGLKILNAILGSTNIAFAIDRLQWLLESIRKETILEIKIEDINDALNIQEFEEQEGRKR